MAKIRSFIAVKLPGNVRKQLEETRNRLSRTSNASVKWVSPENMHLTLKFLGGIEDDTVPRILGVIEEAVGNKRQMIFKTAAPGVFPHPDRVQVVWAGLEGDISRLAELQKEIQERLVPLGFPAESRAFTPHLTLGRVRESANREERRRLGEAVAGFSGLQPVSFTVDSIYLMKSVLTPQGPHYSEIGAAKLG